MAKQPFSATTALSNPLRFALDALGLGWKKLDDLVSQELGGGNSLAVEGIPKLYQGYDQTDSGADLRYAIVVPSERSEDEGGVG